MSEAAKKKVLVVDDYHTMIRIIKKLLVEIGFDDIDVASDGEEALQMIGSEDYDLVISDWNMDKMTGLELLEAVREDPKTKSLPFIMVTAESKPANVLAAKNAGVSNYLVKPFTPATIREKIESVLGPLD
ncbi:response regulator [Salipiger mucosus]|uniref:Chemotaxis regulator-transmits chemoreceptor signals to flagelllar motor component CheY n=1 Tax=Salipiger mucosus DSM 16094 TaxID=1123237 RepID=S9QRN9_9RHOB|nr:response regulator [Salipiger mucosus]EPX84051.1 Chemotaxis regulator - transmits chemoreceptor signals to flagelllar motor component CheY [Salipiger mucosus DSM 16094]